MPSTGVTVPNVLGPESGIIPLNQFDANYSTLAGQMNTLGTYSNGFVDTSLSVGVLSITVPAPLVVGPSQFTALQILANNGNNGPLQLQINGGAAVNVLLPNGQPLGVAQTFNAGDIVTLMFDGTRWQFLSSTLRPNTSIFTGTLTGCTTSPTGVFNYSISDNVVVADCLLTPSGTSNTITATITGVPAILTPVRAQTVVAYVVNNGVSVIGSINIAASVWTLYPGPPGTAFTASGQKGMLSGTVVTYNLT